MTAQIRISATLGLLVTKNQLFKVRRRQSCTCNLYDVNLEDVAFCPCCGTRFLEISMEPKSFISRDTNYLCVVDPRAPTDIQRNINFVVSKTPDDRFYILHFGHQVELVGDEVRTSGGLATFHISAVSTHLIHLMAEYLTPLDLWNEKNFGIHLVVFE